MLRQFLLYLSTAGWAKRIATRWPIARRVARRFVAGETLEEAIQVARTLHSQGIQVTLDLLGESVTSVEDSKVVVATYQALLDRLTAEGFTPSISVKLTHLGLDISEELCVGNLRHIVSHAKQSRIAVTIDMESTAYTDRTLRIYRTLRDECDLDNVGTVIQAYLYRSASDMEALAAEGAHVRLCKGAYLEPPDLAFPQKADVNTNFVKLVEAYLGTNSSAYLCIATHDEQMIEASEKFIKRNNIPSDRYEFQMLYGIRTSRHHELAASGHTMRVYVPFGTAWYPYFMRRLAERPANLWFFMTALFRRN